MSVGPEAGYVQDHLLQPVLQIGIGDLRRVEALHNLYNYYGINIKGITYTDILWLLDAITKASGGIRITQTVLHGLQLEARDRMTLSITTNTPRPGEPEGARERNKTDTEKLGYDAVTLPKHYTRFKIEPIKFIVENELTFWQGSIIKYVLRYDAKNGLEDLKKARRYLDMQIKRMEGDVDWNK